MSDLFTFLGEHQMLVGAILALLLSAAVRALPAPNGSTPFYKWFYNFSHFVLSNYDKIHVK